MSYGEKVSKSDYIDTIAQNERLMRSGMFESRGPVDLGLSPDLDAARTQFIKLKTERPDLVYGDTIIAPLTEFNETLNGLDSSLGQMVEVIVGIESRVRPRSQYMEMLLCIDLKFRPIAIGEIGPATIPHLDMPETPSGSRVANPLFMVSDSSPTLTWEQEYSDIDCGDVYFKNDYWRTQKDPQEIYKEIDERTNIENTVALKEGRFYFVPGVHGANIPSFENQRTLFTFDTII